MNRRTALAGVGVGLSSAVVGCLAGSDTDTGSGPGTVADVEFETGVDVDHAFDDDPTIEFEDDTVRVTGRYSIGSSCYDERLQGPTYDEEADELRLTLTRRHNGADVCNDLDQQPGYRVVVTVDGSLPGVVDVTEDSGGEARVERDSSLFP